MMELESDRIARGNARYSLNNAAYNVEWDEKKHPRGKDGKFGPGGSSGKAKEKAPEKKEKITDLNPTGGVFVDYTPSQRAEMELGENMTTLAETSGGDPDEIVTVYRGIESGDGSINPGDFITTNKQLAQDYAGTGKVVSLDIRLGDILDDSDEPLGEEYLYYPEKKKENSCKPRRFRLMNTVYNVEFDETKHPRGSDGKFGTGGGSAKPETPDREKDLAVVNIPLSKRGNIDTKIDKYKAEQKKQKDAKDKAEFAKVKESRQKDAARGKELFEKHGQAIIDYYSKKTGKSKTDIRALMKEWAQYYPDRLEKAVAQMQPSENACKPKKYRLMNTAYNTDFDESKHPRGADGKFGTGGGSGKTEGKAEIKSKSIKLKQGNVQLKNPIEATYDSVWKEYKINDPRMKGRGVSGKDVTIKDGKVIGVSPSIAKYLELETVGEVQGKTVLVKQKEEKKAQEEKKIQEKAAVMGKALALSDMVRTGKITKDEFNKRMKELNDYKNACKPRKYYRVK